MSILDILRVKDLDVYYSGIKVLSGVSFEVRKGEVYAIVGESGSGKTTTANAILRILPEIARIGSGSRILYNINNEYVNLLDIPEKIFSTRIRWKEISMVFQGALNSLNPVIRVKDHFLETAKAHGIRDSRFVIDKAKELLEAVKLDADRVLRSFPIELSGGMKQRVLIALSLLLSPKMVILDEPTTALDVITQREILLMLKDLKEKLGLTYILITHDIALVADIADRVAVMYAGRIVEEATVEELFYKPAHPYTIGLLKSVPKLGQFEDIASAIPGSPPDFRKLPNGCKFHPRCPFAMDICRREEPPMIEISPGHRVACYLYTQHSRVK